MTLASLPVIDVYIAFNPSGTAPLLQAPQQALPASGASNSYWTNVSAYLRDFSTQIGRQHFLDRVQAGTLKMTLNNRTGFFFNGAAPSGSVDGNGTGYVIMPRLPIAVTLTWSATTHPAFFGLIDAATEVITDQLNSDLDIEASDLTKQLSLKYMSSYNFWKQYCFSAASANNWYRCSTNQTAIITTATATATTATYYAINNLQAGWNVTISGLTNTVTPSLTLNKSNAVVASATSTSFTVTGTFTAGTTTTSQGSVYTTVASDLIGNTGGITGSNNGNYMGQCAFLNYGAVIYDADVGIDIGAGGTTATGYVRLPYYSGTMGGLDFWILGNGISNSIITQTANLGGLFVTCDVNGYLAASVGATVYHSTVKIDDGMWHHIGLVDNSSGTLQLYADGQFFSLSTLGTLTGFTTSGNLVLGFGGQPAYYDEIVVSNTSSLSTLQNEVLNRYVAGTMLQLPTNVTATGVQSGDRIAEVLCLAGFGHLTAGAIVLNTNCYAINDGSAWVKGTAGNGFVTVSPYYWETPVIGSTALDLINQICDTDIGSFFQKPDGTFAFYNQNYYVTWGFTPATLPSTPTTSWSSPVATGTYTPTGNAVWTDDASGYAYEPASLQITRDDADTWTLIKVTPQAGVDQIYENVAAESQWGFSTLTKTSTVHPTLNAALSTAYFLGYMFQSPLPRVTNVEIRSTASNGAQVDAITNSHFGQVILFKHTPPNASTSGTYPGSRGQVIQNMVIESIALEFNADPGELKASFALDPYPIRP